MGLTFSLPVLPVGLLIASIICMRFALHGHLIPMTAPLILVIGVLAAPQRKILQEASNRSILATFPWVYPGKRLDGGPGRRHGVVLS